MQNLSSYHNKKNGRGCCNPSEINGFKIFLNQDLHLLYIIRKIGIVNVTIVKSRVSRLLAFSDLYLLLYIIRKIGIVAESLAKSRFVGY